MAQISARLNKVLQMIKPGIRLPIIVETIRPASNSDVADLSRFMQVRKVLLISNMVFGQADETGIRNLATLPFISIVQYDEIVSTHGALPVISISNTDINIPVSESARFIGAKDLNDIGITGKGIKIAVIDTGCNKNHPMLEGAIKEQYNIAKDNGAINADGQDGNGHGTFVASTAAGREVEIYSRFLGQRVVLRGVAPEAEIIAIKVLDDAGSGQTSWVIEGMEKAVEVGADVINMSLGSIFDNAGLSPDSKVVDTIVYNHNILCAVAAGNSFSNFSIGSPGGARGSLTVGSSAIKTPSAGVVSSFSSKGTTSDGRIKPDISAPGGNLVNINESIYAATSGLLARDAGEPYVGLMGSSMATPHVAGSIALLLQAGMKRDRYFLEDLLAATASYKHVKDVFTGWGTINVKAAYDYLMSGKLPFPVTTFSKIAETSLLPFAGILPQQMQSESSESSVRLPYIR